jgi:murein DD-endopeptidase MepM/ murein hydrolase activator NlpD
VEPLLAPPEATALPTSLPSPTSDPLTGFQICTPLADILLEDLPRLISDGYHPPPVYYSDARHPAIDIAFYNWKGHRQIGGTPVQSVLPGRVTAAEVDTFPMGNVVIVETHAEQIPEDIRAALGMAADKSLYILYAHMQEDSLRVSTGQPVTACQTLGQVGKTGNTLAAHLHLETRLGPVGVSFIGFQGYLEDATVQEKTNYRTWATSGQFLHFDPMRLLMFEIGLTPTPGGLPLPGD